MHLYFLKFLKINLCLKNNKLYRRFFKYKPFSKFFIKILKQKKRRLKIYTLNLKRKFYYHLKNSLLTKFYINKRIRSLKVSWLKSSNTKIKLLFLRSIILKKWYCWVKNLTCVSLNFFKKLQYVKKKKNFTEKMFCLYAWLYEIQDNTDKNFWVRYFETRFGSLIFNFGLFFLDLKVLLYESRIFSFFFLNNQRNSHLNLLNTNLYGIFFFNSKLLCFFCGERLILTCLDFLRFFVFNTFSAFYYFFCINLFYFSNLSCLIQPKFLKFIKKTYPADFFIRYLSFALIFLFSLNCKSLYLKNLHFQKYKQVSYNVFTWFYLFNRKFLKIVKKPSLGCLHYFSFLCEYESLLCYVRHY